VNTAGEQFKIDLTAITKNEFNTYIIYYLMRSLSDLGIKVEPHFPSMSQMKDPTFIGDAEATLYAMNMRTRYFMSYEFWRSKDTDLSSDASQINTFLDKMRFGLSPSERNASYEMFEKALAQDPPLLFLYWRDLPIVLHKRFRGLSEHPWEFTREFKNLWVPKGEQKYRENAGRGT
ncbi:MAG: hypothetical protein HY541_06645, partial [Deltaproteobacteria bacterium]|nr:hypothetical protein [Deltaproteobacteria bacterium]